MSKLKKYELEDTAVLHLKDARDRLMYAENEDGSEDVSKPMRVWAYGPGSKEYQEAQSWRSREVVDMMRPGKLKTAEENSRIGSEFLSRITHSWENVEGEAGATGRELSLEIYGNPKLPHIRDQVAGFAAETANFTRPSTAS